MMDKMRRRYQKSFSKALRELNRSIADDNLWKGRFIFMQKDAGWEKFSDGSGGILHIIVRGYDKVTGYYHDDIISYAIGGGHMYINKLYYLANKFITEYSSIWKTVPRISVDNTPDCRKVKFDWDEVISKEPNYYISEAEFKWS